MRCALIVIVSGTAMFGGCDDDQASADLAPVERAETHEDVMHARSVAITDVVEAPARYDGHSVRIRGAVREMLTPRAIVLEANGLLGTRSVVVLTREPANPMGWLLQPGQQAVAVGIVRSADVTTVERHLGRQLEPEIRRAIGSAPVVIAHSVGRVHGNNIDWTNPAGIRTEPTR